MKFFSFLLSFVVGSSALGVVPMKFDILRGPTFDTAAKVYNNQRFMKRDTGGTVTLPMKDEFLYYIVTLNVDDADLIVHVDTGSSDLWFYGNDNPYCESSTGKKFTRDLTSSVETSLDESIATIDCAKWGTFDINSKSFHNNYTEFLTSYADSTYAYGTWGYADVTFNDVTLKDFSFAVANQSNASVPILGIGLMNLEVTEQPFIEDFTPYEYLNFPAALKAQGLINRNLYSLYIDANSSEGLVLFGGIDHGKYSGDLITLPFLSDDGVSTPDRFYVELQGITISDSQETVDVYSTPVAAMLDSGTSYLYLPTTAYSNLVSALGAQYYEEYGFYVVNCPTSSTGITVDYIFDGLTIPVPIDDSLIPLETGSQYCAVMVFPSDSTVILGDTFLRYTYVVYDLENMQSQMGLYTDGESNIEVVGGSSGSEPGSGSISSTNVPPTTSIQGTTSTVHSSISSVPGTNVSGGSRKTISGSSTAPGSSSGPLTTSHSFVPSGSITTSESSSFGSSNTKTGSDVASKASASRSIGSSLLFALSLLFAF